MIFIIFRAKSVASAFNVEPPILPPPPPPSHPPKIIRQYRKHQIINN